MEDDSRGLPQPGPIQERFEGPVEVAVKALRLGWSLLEAAAIADDWARDDDPEGGRGPHRGPHRG